MTTSTVTITTMKPDTYAIMVHRLFVDRVKEYLLVRETPWNQSKPFATTVVVLDSPAETGVSRERRGFVVILLEEIQRPIESLPAKARQNISFAGKITHKASSSDGIWPALVKEERFDFQKHSVRVDVYPREQSESVCLALQSCCAKDCGLAKPDPTDPFEGGIWMTKSAGKCTHRLTVVLSNGEYFWGLLNRQTSDRPMMEMKLNQEAQAEIIVEAVRTETKQFVEKTGIDPKLPLSRAYYKLQQAWREHIESEEAIVAALANGDGLDLGACPGGWTQVLVHLMKLENVVAVDPGIPANRILDLPQVTHVKQDMTNADLSSYGPFSTVVCDACVIWIEIMKQMKATVVNKAKWTLPSLWVITMKLPFKTLGSVQRHVELMHEEMAEHLDDMASKMYTGDKVSVRHKIVHLMANSDSERTLIAIFDKPQA